MAAGSGQQFVIVRDGATGTRFLRFWRGARVVLWTSERSAARRQRRAMALHTLARLQDAGIAARLEAVDDVA